MFSIITMASSTTNPVAMVNAIRDRLSRLYPRKYIAAKVPTRDKGTATLGMMVAERLRKNRKMTITTRPMVSINSNSTSATDALIAVVRSVSVVIRILAGRLGWGWGNSCLMLFSTLVVLGSGWRCTFRITGGVVFIHAACL